MQNNEHKMSQPAVETGGHGKPVLRHRVFVSARFTFQPKNDYRERFRKEAETFVNAEVGQDNVVAICESETTLSPFSVVVWYRSSE
jgi:hypothetical protein